MSLRGAHFVFGASRWYIPRSTMRRVPLLIALATALLVPSAARAGRCKIDSIGNMAFGQYNVFSAAPLDALGSIGYDCSATPGPVITLSRGSSGTYDFRTLQQGANVLRYNVFLDANRSIVFGDDTGNSSAFDGRNGRKQLVALYGRIFVSQSVPAGTYSDTLVATLEF
jgi:spore coat protein U-like protein